MRRTRRIAAAVLAAGLVAAAPAAAVEPRGYELVSPQAKGNTDISGDARGAGAQAAVDGNAVVYTSNGAFPGVVRGGALPYTYRAIRTATGWRNESLTPPSRSNWANCGNCSAGNTGQVIWLTDDLERAIVSTNLPHTPGATDASNLYTQLNPGSAFSLLTPGAPTGAQVTLENHRYIYFQGATEDFGHVVFSTSHPMTPDAVPHLGTPSGSLYVAHAGTVELVSIDPDGNPFVDLPIQLGDDSELGGWDENRRRHAISRDGSRIFFQVAGDVYVRKDGSDTDRIPDSEDFFAADPAGEQALVAIGGQEVTPQLQLYDVDSGTGVNIAPGCHGCDFVAASEDLRTIYFVDRAAHEPGQPAIPEGHTGLYVRRDGTTRHIATIADRLDDFRTQMIPSREVRDSIDDGSVLAFVAGGAVDGADNGGHFQVYVYDAEADELACASCPPGGAPTADAWLGLSISRSLGTTYTHALGDRHNVSADGRRVFFQTSDALVPQDSNGMIDVYVWENGAAHLVSDGKSRHDARFVAASASGNDVFFATRAQLTGGDRDDYVDLYDARVGGGFPEPAPPAPGCSGDGCQALPTAAPAAPALGSVALTGDGDVPRGAKPRARVARRALRRGAVALSVTTQGAGRVTIAGARVVTTRRRVGRGGTHRIAVRLDRAARRALVKGGRLRVRVRVTFAPPGARPSAAATLRFRAQA